MSTTETPGNRFSYRWIMQHFPQLVGERVAVPRVNDKLYVRRIRGDIPTSEITSSKIGEIEGARYSHRRKSSQR